ncbi:MAG: hypothetical protein V8S14_00025 [Lachnospiraceae bacterium]
MKQIITSAGQLNEKEALKVDMVADVSGSMDGGPLDGSKTDHVRFCKQCAV